MMYISSVAIADFHQRGRHFTILHPAALKAERLTNARAGNHDPTAFNVNQKEEF